MSDQFNCVVVERLPFGTSSFSCSTADCFEHDVLTVSCTDADFDAQFGPMRVFQPTQWSYATVYDDQGHVLFTFTSDAGKHAKADWLASLRTPV